MSEFFNDKSIEKNDMVADMSSDVEDSQADDEISTCYSEYGQSENKEKSEGFEYKSSKLPEDSSTSSERNEKIISSMSKEELTELKARILTGDEEVLSRLGFADNDDDDEDNFQKVLKLRR